MTNIRAELEKLIDKWREEAVRRGKSERLVDVGAQVTYVCCADVLDALLSACPCGCGQPRYEDAVHSHQHTADYCTCPHCMAAAPAAEMETQGWKVCCSQTKVIFDTKQCEMVLTCPHGRQFLGIPSLKAAVAAEEEKRELKRLRNVAEDALEAAADCKVPDGYNSAQIMRIIGTTRAQAKQIEAIEEEKRRLVESLREAAHLFGNHPRVRRKAAVRQKWRST